MYRSEYANESADSFKELYELHKRIRELEKELEAAKKKSAEWISVKDGLPDESDETKPCEYRLIALDDGRVCIGWLMPFDAGYVRWFMKDDWGRVEDVTERVTHWLNPPEPPKEAHHA